VTPVDPDHKVCDNGICIYKLEANQPPMGKGKSNDSFYKLRDALFRSLRWLITVTVRDVRPYIVPIAAAGLRVLLEEIQARRH